MKYTVVLCRDPEEGVYNVTVPALPGCFTWGRTKREAYRMARQAIEGYLESLAKDGERAPIETESRAVKV